MEISVKGISTKGTGIDALKYIADNLGLPYAPNIGETKLRERIDKFVLDNPDCVLLSDIGNQNMKSYECWASMLNIPSWEGVAVAKAERWSGGKALTKDGFEEAVYRLHSRSISGQ